MKKFIVMLAICACYASAAFGATIVPTTADAGKVLHGDATAASATTVTISRLSKGVVLGANYSTSGYAIITFYNFTTWKQGEDKVFGTSHDSTAIYSSIPSAAPTAAPTAADTSVFSSWTAM